VAEAIYGAGIALMIASVGTFYYLRQASKDYLDERRISAYEAIRKLISLSKDWREMFQVELAEEKVTIQTEPGECNSNRQLAKELKCTCKCGGRNHGAALKQHIKPLDDFTEKDMQTEYEKYMNTIDWPKVLLQPPRERDSFGPDVEPDKKVVVLS